jgi:hypothetical protein
MSCSHSCKLQAKRHQLWWTARQPSPLSSCTLPAHRCPVQRCPPPHQGIRTSPPAGPLHPARRLPMPGRGGCRLLGCATLHHGGEGGGGVLLSMAVPKSLPGAPPTPRRCSQCSCRGSAFRSSTLPHPPEQTHKRRAHAPTSARGPPGQQVVPAREVHQHGGNREPCMGQGQPGHWPCWQGSTVGVLELPIEQDPNRLPAAHLPPTGIACLCSPIANACRAGGHSTGRLGRPVQRPARQMELVGRGGHKSHGKREHQTQWGIFCAGFAPKDLAVLCCAYLATCPRQQGPEGAPRLRVHDATEPCAVPLALGLGAAAQLEAWPPSQGGLIVAQATIGGVACGWAIWDLAQLGEAHAIALKQATCSAGRCMCSHTHHGGPQR